MYSVAVNRQHTNDLHVYIIHFCGELPCVVACTALHTPAHSIYSKLLLRVGLAVLTKKKRLIFIFHPHSRVVFSFSFFFFRRVCASPPTLLPAPLKPIAVADVCCCCIVQCLLGAPLCRRQNRKCFWPSRAHHSSNAASLGRETVTEAPLEKKNIWKCDCPYSSWANRHSRNNV